MEWTVANNDDVDPEFEALMEPVQGALLAAALVPAELGSVPG
jgi:hypothetical protein